MNEYISGEEDYETMGEEFSTVGAVRGRPALRRPSNTLRLPAAPGWRQGYAPGVGMPGEGMEQLPLTPAQNNGIFTATLSQIDFVARPQRAFRGERPLIVFRGVGTSAAQVIANINPGIFIGTQIVGSELGPVPIEGFGPQAFGVRLTMPQATPGMIIRIPIQLQGVLTGTDTLLVSCSLIGRVIR